MKKKEQFFMILYLIFRIIPIKNCFIKKKAKIQNFFFAFVLFT